MAKNKALLIGGGLIAVAIAAYFIFKPEPPPGEVAAQINSFTITAT